MSKIIQLYSDKDKKIKAYPKTLASQVYMDDGTTTINSQLESIMIQVSNTSELINSLSKLKNKKGTIKLLQGEYLINIPLDIWNGIDIISNGNAVIKRNFNKDVAYGVFSLHGNNIIDGVKFDGNSTNIPQVDSDYINYGEVVSNSENVTIKNCLFNNACGSFIVLGSGANNIKIEKCSFGEYRDHSIYMNSDKDISSKNVIISSNTFSSLHTRDAIKIRNNVQNIFIDKNNYSLPNAPFLNIEGFSSVPTLYNIVNVKVTNNRGTSQYFLNTLGEGIINNLLIDSNNFTTNSCFFRFGYDPNATSQNGTNISDIKITNNVINAKREIILNGLISYGIKEFIFENNVVNLNSTSLVNAIGRNEKVYFLNNVFNSSINSVLIFNLNTQYSQPYNYSNENLTIKNNIVNGKFTHFINEYSSVEGVSFNKWDINVSDNIFNSDVWDRAVIINYRLTTTNKIVEYNNYKKNGLYEYSTHQNLTIKDVVKNTLEYQINTTFNVGTNIIEIPITKLKNNDSVIVNPKYDMDGRLLISSISINNDKITLKIYNINTSQLTFNGTLIITTIKNQ